MLTEEKMQPQKPPDVPEPKRGHLPDAPRIEPLRAEPKKKSSLAIWILLIAGCVVAALVYSGLKRRQAASAAAGARFGQQPIVPVLAGAVEEKDVPIYLDGLGTVQAYYTVTIHVRVDGELKKVAFTEGQDVKAGDLLAQIDPDPYQTAYDQAVAKKAEDEAQLVNAQIGLKREIDLIAAKIDAQQVYDTQKALADQMDATVKADQAAIESAAVNLNYTKITSPINGRTGIRQMDPGNIAHATDTNGLVVITQLKPISVIFTLPEQYLEKIQKERARTGADLKVLAVDRDNTEVLDEGTLAVIDNQIDTTTGTIRIKANFPNLKELLWPGQFVNPRLLLTVHSNGLVVPTAAVQRGPTGAYVFVIDEGSPKSGKSGGKGKKPDGAAAMASDDPPKQKADGQGDGGKDGKQPALYVKMQPVTVAPEVTGAESLITAGLQKGQRIVVDGQYKLQDGSPIRIVSPDKAAGTVDSRSSDSVQ